MKIQGILGGLEVIKDYYRKAQETAFEFIKEDQRQVLTIKDDLYGNLGWPKHQIIEGAKSKWY